MSYSVNAHYLKQVFLLLSFFQNSTQAIRDKIRATKAKNNSEETINDLEEIINSLITEKNELISIAQTYDEQLVSQKISEEDIKFITTNILPL